MTILGLSVTDWIVIVPTIFGAIAWFIKLERSVRFLEVRFKEAKETHDACSKRREEQFVQMWERTERQHEDLLKMLSEIQHQLGILRGKIKE